MPGVTKKKQTNIAGLVEQNNPKASQRRYELKSWLFKVKGVLLLTWEDTSYLSFWNCSSIKISIINKIISPKSVH